MTKSEFRKTASDIKRTVTFLKVKPYSKGTRAVSCYSIKVNCGCVRETADLWDDWLDCWNVDDFVENYQDQYERVTQVSLRLFNPSDVDEDLEGKQFIAIVFDIRRRLSEGVSHGHQRWKYDY